MISWSIQKEKVEDENSISKETEYFAILIVNLVEAMCYLIWVCDSTTIHTIRQLIVTKVYKHCLQSEYSSSFIGKRFINTFTGESQFTLKNSILPFRPYFDYSGKSTNQQHSSYLNNISFCKEALENTVRKAFTKVVGHVLVFFFSQCNHIGRINQYQTKLRRANQHSGETTDVTCWARPNSNQCSTCRACCRGLQISPNNPLCKITPRRAINVCV